MNIRVQLPAVCALYTVRYGQLFALGCAQIIFRVGVEGDEDFSVKAFYLFYSIRDNRLRFICAESSVDKVLLLIDRN